MAKPFSCQSVLFFVFSMHMFPILCSFQLDFKMHILYTYIFWLAIELTVVCVCAGWLV